MATKLTAKNKLEALNKINQAITIANLEAEKVVFSIGKTKSARLSELDSLNWNDLRSLVRNLDSAVFSYELDDGVQTEIDIKWDDITQRLLLQSLGNTQHIRVISESSQVIEAKEETAQPLGVTEFSAVIDPDLLGGIDLFSDDFDFTIEETQTAEDQECSLLSELVPESKEEPAEVLSLISDVVETNEEEAHNNLDSLELPVFIGQKDEEDKLIKKPANITSLDLLPLLDAWLQATGQKNQFLQALREAKKLGHNSLVVYPYPAIEFVINNSGKLIKRIVRSETIQQITNRPGTIIQRTGRASSPLYSNLFYISPIRTTDGKGNVYLTQTYLKRIQGEFTSSWQQQSHNIAWFDGGNLHYFKDLEHNKRLDVIAEHNLYPIIEADGIDIFPDLSIAQISLECLSPSINGLYETTKDNRYFDKANQKPSNDGEADRVSEKYLIKPRIFQGYSHPNLKPKKVQKAEITERKIPKPAKLDGSRTNDHEYQLRAIIGNVPMILTFKSSDHLWDVIALPIKVSPYHLSVYLSDKVGSTELLSYIDKHKQDLNYNLAKNEVKIEGVNKILADLSHDDRFLPRRRSLEVEIESLLRVSNGIKAILDSLETLIINTKQNRKPDRLDVLESTKIIREILKSEHIKPESSYTDNYYCWHNIGTLRILEQIETEKPTYDLTIIGDEKDTRRSSVPLVMQWLRRVPKILQDHFRESYPTNQEIKDHLMSIYPFYKRKLKEGDKVDKSYINVEADMVIKTKGKLTIEIYFNNQHQTTQVLSITKPVKEQHRQGKIPVKISSSVEITSYETLTHLLRCDSYRQTFEAQNHLNKLVQKFVDSNIKLFTKERETKIVSRVAIKDLLGFSKESKGYPQVAKQFNKFTLPYTSESAVNLGKLINLLTLETFDKHDAANLLDKMVNNWKHWNKSNTINLAGFNFTKKDPGELMVNIFHTVKHNQNRSQIIWGAFIDELYKLSGIAVGFRTVEGVILTPWSLLPTDRKTWEHRIKIQLIDILSFNQREKIQEVEELVKNAKTKEEGKALRDNIRGGSVEGWLRIDIDDLYSQLFKARPNWESLVHPNVLSHLSALHDALEVTTKI